MTDPRVQALIDLGPEIISRIKSRTMDGRDIESACILILLDEAETILSAIEALKKEFSDADNP